MLIPHAAAAAAVLLTCPFQQVTICCFATAIRRATIGEELFIFLVRLLLSYDPPTCLSRLQGHASSGGCLTIKELSATGKGKVLWQQLEWGGLLLWQVLISDE